MSSLVVFLHSIVTRADESHANANGQLYVGGKIDERWTLKTGVRLVPKTGGRWEVETLATHPQYGGIV